MKFSISKKAQIKFGAYAVFILVFWFLGPAHKMTPATAFFGLGALTIVFEVIYNTINKALEKSKKT